MLEHQLQVQETQHQMLETQHRIMKQQHQKIQQSQKKEMVEKMVATMKVENLERKHQKLVTVEAKKPERIQTNKKTIGCGEFRHSLNHYI